MVNGDYSLKSEMPGSTSEKKRPERLKIIQQTRLSQHMAL